MTPMRVLVVEDDCVSLAFLKNSLKHFGYEVTSASNGKEAYDLLRTGEYRLVISDWEMPEMCGDELCRVVRSRTWNSYIYIILVTSYGGIDRVVEGLKAGADDFLSKPYHPDELRIRLRTGQRMLSLESRDAMLFTVAKLTESRDVDTGAHLERMREYCRILVQELGSWKQYRDVIDGEYVQLIYLTAPLHDIGKIAIPDNVLLKPGRLTSQEFEIMKRHTTIGGDTLKAVTQAYPEAQYLSMARDIAYTHHERFDGSGYPFGLKGTDIPLCGRITALADVYDALTSRRVYKPRMSHEETRQIILDGAGAHFDPDVVQAFINCEAAFVRVANALSPEHATPSNLIPCDAGTHLSPTGSLHATLVPSNSQAAWLNAANA